MTMPISVPGAAPVGVAVTAPAPAAVSAPAMLTLHELDLLRSPIPPGLTVIEASAGTGKTYSISHLVPRLLLEGTVPDLGKLLLVTFTRDAARELAERVRRVLTTLAAPPQAGETVHLAGLRQLLARPGAQARLDRALLDLDLLAVSTIHAFCQRTLQQEGALCGLPVLPEVVTEDVAQLQPLWNERWIADLATQPLLAALATARGWQIAEAENMLKLLRSGGRCGHYPKLPDVETLLAQVAEQLTVLKSPPVQAGWLAVLARVKTWNQDFSYAQCAAWLESFWTSSPEHPFFWLQAQELVGLPKFVYKRDPAYAALFSAAPRPPWWEALLKLAELTAQLRQAWLRRLVATVQAKLADVLGRHRLITQDGLITALHAALHRRDAVGAGQAERLAARLAERYQVGLIDESQDTDPRQLAIFQRIFLSRPVPQRLVMVGDPKQAIYGFRGADLGTYLAARVQAERGYKLTFTHRAPAPLVETVNRLFGRPQPFHLAALGFAPARSALTKDRRLLYRGQPCARLQAWVASDQEREFTAKSRRWPAISARVSSMVVDLLHHGSLQTVPMDGVAEPPVSVSPRDFAVLVADHQQATAMAQALEARGVPVVVNAGADVFGTEEATDLWLLLRAVWEPRRLPLVRRALATQFFGMNAADLAAVDEAGVSVWPERFVAWQQLWLGRGLAALLAEWETAACALSQRLATHSLDGERRVTNFRQLTDLLLAVAREEAPRPDEQVRWLGQQIAGAEQRTTAEEKQLQLSGDRAAVQVLTMHKAKGLEYALVFCPYLAESLRAPADLCKISATQSGAGQDVLVALPLVEAAEQGRWREAYFAGQLEERIRLTYVALTRAQVGLWLCSYSGSAKKEDHGSALDWLLQTQSERALAGETLTAWQQRMPVGRAARHTQALADIAAGGDDAGGVVGAGQAGAAVRAELAGVTPLLAWGPPPEPTVERYSPPTQAGATAPTAAAMLVAVGGDRGRLEPDASPPLTALPKPATPTAWRVTSFSTLTRERHAHGAPTAAAAVALAETVAPVPRVMAESATEDSALEGVEPAPPLFLTAPAGAAVGTAVHDYLETWDFSPPSAADVEKYLETVALPAPKGGAPGWPAQFMDLLTTLRLIWLPGLGDVPLHQLCPQPHGSEWHFHLPLVDGLTAAKLARCFAEHAAPAHRDYAPQLAALSEDKFDGLLQGFIDRLARHGQAWGVIDWKTNRLGATLADYDEAALLHCAKEAHYLLQTHLYLVALRRYLRALGLDTAVVAGAWLVFLRAVAPGSSRGVLHIQPPAAMLDALDALFAPAGGAL